MESWLLFGVLAYVSYGISTAIDKHLMDGSFEPLPTNMQKMLFDGIILSVLGVVVLQPTFSTGIIWQALVLGGVYAASGVIYFHLITAKDVEEAIPVRQAGVTLFSFLGAVVLFSEFPGPLHYIGVAASVVGMYLLLSRDGPGLPPWDHGLTLLAASTGMGVVYWLLVKAFVGSSTPIALAIAMYLVTAGLLAAYMHGFTDHSPLTYFQDRDRVGRIGVTSLFGALGTFFLYTALAAGQGSDVYPLAGIQSLVIFVLATILLREQFTWHRGLGLVGVVVGVALISL